MEHENEPSGPPFYDVTFLGEPTYFGAPTYFADGAFSRPWGITSIPITYEPQVSDPSQLAFVQQATPDRPDLVRCRLQTEPARQLPTLQGIPIVILVTEASYHAPYDHCTSKYLDQAGVQHTFISLEEVGIPGSGHMLMLEKGSLAIARVVSSWLREHVEQGAEVAKH